MDESGSLGANRQRERIQAGDWTTRWSPSGARLRLLSTGREGSATRELEVWVEPVSGALWRVVGWREIR